MIISGPFTGPKVSWLQDRFHRKNTYKSARFLWRCSAELSLFHICFTKDMHQVFCHIPAKITWFFTAWFNWTETFSYHIQCWDLRACDLLFSNNNGCLLTKTLNVTGKCTRMLNNCMRTRVYLVACVKACAGCFPQLPDLIYMWLWAIGKIQFQNNYIHHGALWVNVASFIDSVSPAADCFTTSMSHYVLSVCKRGH